MVMYIAILGSFFHSKIVFYSKTAILGVNYFFQYFIFLVRDRIRSDILSNFEASFLDFGFVFWDDFWVVMVEGVLKNKIPQKFWPEKYF